MRILSVVGARPQFVKAAFICRAIARDLNLPTIQHLIVHTGQHYDDRMSGVFFRQLDIPTPDYNLDVGSARHGSQTGEMLKRLEPVIISERPDWILLYGDTNSTLAGAVAGAKVTGVKLAHLEAGLRSFDRAMPEEVNRTVADHLSDLLLCPTKTAVENLTREGLGSRSVLTGDVMYDAFLVERDAARKTSSRVVKEWSSRQFALATIHREENTDQTERLERILKALETVSREICPVLLPLHPRTQKTLEKLSWRGRFLHVSEPVSYHEMLLLEGSANFILTDSGGVQKEAYFANKPCITLRDETEWTETLANRCNVLVGADERRIIDACQDADTAGPWTVSYGDGNAGAAVLSALWCRR